MEIVKDSYLANKDVCFGGDNYSEEWHAEAERRGLKNLRTTPDALPEVIATDTVAAFEKYSVLNERELESRYEVWVEQYAMRANIEAETTHSIAQDDDPAGGAALRWPDRRVGTRPRASGARSSELLDEMGEALAALEQANAYPETSRASTWRSTPATSSWRRWTTSARPPTSSSGSSPTTSGRCRSTRRCSSSSSRGAGPGAAAAVPGRSRPFSGIVAWRSPRMAAPMTVQPRRTGPARSALAARPLRRARWRRSGRPGPPWRGLRSASSSSSAAAALLVDQDRGPGPGVAR